MDSNEIDEIALDVVATAYPISEDTLRRCFPNSKPVWLLTLFGVLSQHGVNYDILIESVDQTNEDIDEIRKRMREAMG
ncbi:MAG: hypothetical protein WC329_08425 [Candidatus Omnitrophota bacterium]|jgi:hypothetical protein